jgi:hypothetical protein
MQSSETTRYQPYAELKGLVKYQYNDLTEEEIQEAIDYFLKRENKAEVILNDSGRVKGVGGRSVISWEDFRFLTNLAGQDSRRFDMSYMCRLGAIYGIF